MEKSCDIEELTNRGYDLSDAQRAVWADAHDLYMRLLDAVWSDLESVYGRETFRHSPNTRETSNFIRPDPEQAAVLQHLVGLCDLLDTVRPIYQQRGRHPEPPFHPGVDLCSRRVADIKQYAVMQIATIGMDDETLWLCLGHVLKPWMDVKHIMEERDVSSRRVDELRALALQRATDTSASPDEQARHRAREATGTTEIQTVVEATLCPAGRRPAGSNRTTHREDDAR